MLEDSDWGSTHFGFQTPFPRLDGKAEGGVRTEPLRRRAPFSAISPRWAARIPGAGTPGLQAWGPLAGTRWAERLDLQMSVSSMAVLGQSPTISSIHPGKPFSLQWGGAACQPACWEVPSAARWVCETSGQAVPGLLMGPRRCSVLRPWALGTHRALPRWR